MDIVIGFKSGQEILIKCEGFKVERNAITKEIVGYSISKISMNKPLYIAVSEINYILRLGEIGGEE